MEMTFQGIIHAKGVVNMAQHVEGRITVIAPLYETNSEELEKFYPANINIEITMGEKSRGHLHNARFPRGAASIQVTKDGTFLHTHLQAIMGKDFKVADDLVGEKVDLTLSLIQASEGQPELEESE